MGDRDGSGTATVLLMINTDLRLFFRQPRNLVILPLTLCSTFLALWPYIGSMFAPVSVAVFLALEPRTNNILFHTPHEFDALVVLPTDWKRVLLAKNSAVTLLALLLFLVISVFTAYFAPVRPDATESIAGVLCFLSVHIPLMAIGNLRSVQSPRRQVGFALSDSAGALVTLVLVGLLSLPSLVLALHSPLLCLVYILAAAVLWFRFSIPDTVRRISLERMRLCQTR
jgi:hypothetical protein